jgi:hypothetical protein
MLLTEAIGLRRAQKLSFQAAYFPSGAPAPFYLRGALVLGAPPGCSSYWEFSLLTRDTYYGLCSAGVFYVEQGDICEDPDCLTCMAKCLMFQTVDDLWSYLPHETRFALFGGAYGCE